MNTNESQVITATTADFDALVRQSEIPTVVDVWADWCGPCKMLAPFLDKFAAQYAGKLRVVKLNFDSERELAKSFGIDSIPRLLFFKEGELADQKIGMPDYAGLNQWFGEFLALAEGSASTSVSETSESTPAESAFADAVAAADKANGETVAPAREIYDAAVAPVMAKLDAYKTELEGEGVEGDDLKTRLQARQKELWPEIEPAYEAYAAVAKPATAAYIAAIEAAVAVYINGVESDETSVESVGETRGKVCAIGDPTCQS